MRFDTTAIRLSANTGSFRGNDLFIDSTYHGDTVRVRAELRSNPAVWKETVIYIRRRGFTERLPTSEEILHGKAKNRKDERDFTDRQAPLPPAF